MAPPKAALAQSESKARFFERLGLEEENETHRRLYSMMKEEAVEGRKRMTASPDSLAPQFRDDPRVEPPYSNAQISETAIHREILRIYQHSRRETRAIYDLGRDPERVEEENWVIRWMLWHVFRYRDNRNRNRRPHSPNQAADDDGEDGSRPPYMQPNASSCKRPELQLYHFARADFMRIAGSVAPTMPVRETYWDPVRNA